MYDAIVIGGGIVGASAAYHLVNGGARTLLIDRADVGRATDAGAGIVTAGTGGINAGDAWFDLALKASPYYQVLVEQLNDSSAEDTGYRLCGLLRVAMDDEEVQSLENFKRRVTERQQRYGFPQASDLYDISPSEAQRLFPPLGSVQRAIYFSQAARVDGRQMAAALLKIATQRGLIVRQGSVSGLAFGQATNIVTGVVVDGETLAADHVIIAGGAWSPAFGEQLGVDIPVEPSRGQIIHLGLPNTDTADWPIVEPFRGHYLVSWPDSRVVAGATREKVGFQTTTTVTGIQEVLSEALRVAPGLSSAQFREIRVGLRPATPDQLPVLGPVSGVDGVYLATGMGATGLHLGPYSGKLAADWALGKEPEVSIFPYRVERFKNLA